MVDNYSHLIWVLALKQKSEAFKIFLKFKNLTKVEKKVKVGSFRTDHWGEVNSLEFLDFYVEHGIMR